MKRLEPSASLVSGGTLAGLVWGLALSLSATVFGQVSGSRTVHRDEVVARVNGAAITVADLSAEVETIYPSNTAHGGLDSEKMREIRSKALDELIVRELAYQEAVKLKAVVPMAETQAEYQRLRQKLGPAAFDRDLQSSGLTSQQYLKQLQRRMTLERLMREKIVLPSRVGPNALRTYYDQNLEKFQRPEQVHARLITATVDPQAKPEDVAKAKAKIDSAYRQLQGGKDFGSVAEQYSDDLYRVKGGDLGWLHRGRLEPDFEKVAFALPVGKFSEPFRTSYGYCLMKVEGREPARQMAFAEISPALQQELEQKKMLKLRNAWVEQLKKNAQIEIVADTPDLRAGH
jgi:parvulin-like peptidyl-prolyl isomerase